MPIGSILSGEDSSFDSSPDSMWLVPRRYIYQIDDRFIRNEEFQIFFVENGAVLNIDPADPGVVVEMENGYYTQAGQFIPESPKRAVATYQSFFRVGTHKVTVTLQGRTADYDLEVQSPNNGNGIGGDGGIGIIWVD